MAITPPPTPPNTGNPAQLEERADAFFGWFPTMVADFNSDLGRLNSRYRVTRTGTADAIILTGGFTQLVAGTQVSFRATASNTEAPTINLDGLGVRQTRTITAAEVPPGYVRTGADTVATYDGTYWVLDRQIERGVNANGSLLRFADGTQVCQSVRGIAYPSVATGALFRGEPEHTWTFPAAFATTDDLIVSASPRSPAILWARARTLTAQSGGIILLSSVSSSGTILCEAFAIGRWY